MYRRVRAYIKQNRMIQPGDTVIAGISGGGDSMAMLAMLRACREDLDFRLYAVHVNHGIRGAEAGRDEALVEKVCRQWQIPCRSVHYSVPELARQWKKGEEETGRLVRREAFQEEIRRLGVSGGQAKIALAHNEDDLAETMLHNLCRGSGLRGLSSMRPVAGNIIRPVLCLEKKEIGDYLREEGIPYVTDSSNLSDEYTRNRIRHHVLPLLKEAVNPRAAEHMAETAGLLAQAEEYLSRQGEALLQQYGKRQEEGYFLPDALLEAEKAVASYAVLTALEQVSGKKQDFTSFHVYEAMELKNKQPGRRADLPYGLTAKRTYGGVLLLQKQRLPAKGPEEEWEIPVPGELVCPLGNIRARVFDSESAEIQEKKYTKWLDYDIIECKLSFRTRRTGDYLVINKAGGKKKLNRCFIDEKIPAGLRDRIPLAAAGQEVLWIVGGRINEKYKITPHTRRILELNYEGGTI